MPASRCPRPGVPTGAGRPFRLGPVRRIRSLASCCGSFGAGEREPGAADCKAEEGDDTERRQPTTTP
ncbi:hypothetical protein DT019_28770 [Streptomyces sp. SDr-06]|nr:hypothetical protein DT019_28770 [Streptomyces sp. SDr-06]